MKFSFLSIRFQIVVAFTLLLVPLLLVAYFSVTSQSEFSKSHGLVVENDAITLRVASLERDVVDMQRNAFIYKESSSLSAKKKVDRLYQTVMLELKNLSRIDIMAAYESEITDMRYYLSEYYTNFNMVSDYVTRVEKIKENLLNSEFFISQNGLIGHGHSGLSEEQDHLVAEAKAEILLYLVSYDSVHINRSKKVLTQLGSLSSKPNDEFSQSKVAVFKRSLSDVVSLRRNYIYLVNVVMAGNANEILYNANYLTDSLAQQSEAITKKTDAYIKEQRNIGVVISVVGIILAVLAGAYFFWLITQPIISITEVFNHLAKGNKIKQIPGLDRSDEIGHLAKSAAVFKHKNEQTEQLLNESRLSEKIHADLNKDLKVEKAKAEQALKVRSSFLANMSHELRTPLNSIIGFTVRLIKTAEREDSKHVDVLKTIQRNGRHLLTMINDILDLSKIEENKLELSVSKFDLGELLQEVIDQIAVSAEDKHLTLDVQAQSVIIVSDPIRLTQILLNLLSNSVKYTEQGTITCSIDVDETQQRVDIIIADTGIGIKEEDLGRLFSRFEQFASDRTSKIGFGTGLGLAIVDNVTKLLGGEATATSEYGVGSRFVVTLPLEFDSDNAEDVVNVA